MKAEYPDRLDDFRLPLSREEYNAGVTEDRPTSPLRYAYILREIERKLTETADAVSKAQSELEEQAYAVDQRFMTVEDELDAITKNALTDVGFGLQKIDNTVRIADPINGELNVTDTIRGQNGHGQFTDFPSLEIGYQNLRNGVVRFNCIDTANYVEIESPDGILANRKQYLQDVAGKLAVEETDGLINASNGFKVGGVQVVQARLPSVYVTPDAPVGTATINGVGFKTSQEFDDFVAYVSSLRDAISDLRDRMVAHGLVEA